MSTRSTHTRFKLVVLRDVYQLWQQTDNQMLKDMFYNSVKIKLRGYGAEYPTGILPVDTSDFVSTHVLICLDEKGDLKPISGWKSIGMEVANHHRIAFSGLSLVQNSGTEQHIQAVKKVIENCQIHKKNLVYTSCWATLPEYRKDKIVSAEILRYFDASYYLYHNETEVDEILAGGTLRMKADRYLERMGHDFLSLDGKTLEPIMVKHLFDEKVQVLHLKKFAQYVIEQSELLKNDWQNRIEISLQSVSDMRRLKVA